MDDASALVVLGLIVIAVWLWRRRGRGSSGQAEAQLSRICLGDAGQVERLINFELTRSPGMSRAEAAGRAVARYQRDNR